MGKPDAATSCLAKCASIHLQRGQLQAEQETLLNLAYVHVLAGEIHEASKLYHETEANIAKYGERTSITHHLMSALALTIRGDYTIANQRLDRCKSLLKNYPREYAIYFENLGFLHLQEQEIAQCRKALRAGLEISLRIAPESALVSQIKRLQADCAVATGKFAEARKHATEALAVAEKIGQRLEIAACWRVFAQVAAAAGKADEARNWFYKSIDLFSQISARYELAVARYVAAASGMFERSESVALLFLAKEYCEAEQVAPYIAKIDTALAKLEPRKPALSPINRTIDGPLIAANKKMLSLLDLARHVAPTTMAVLLTGETGTGKDLLARWIHDQSGRTGRFLSQNFAALPSGLEESELFGHRKGAFTGASDEKTGLFEASEHGTFFLNEIADSPMELQAKLLEVLETRSIRRIGETNDRPVDIRIIAATNHDLAKMVRENRFRADLFHRLNEINITLPPLAARTDDIPLLVQQFIADSGVSVENGSARHIERLSSILAMREWPGNIRELRTFVRKLMMIADNDIGKLVEIAQQEMPDGEEMQLARILEQSDWNQTRVADALGLSEGAVRKRIRKYGLDRI
jgi:DNA-binding NtrC family response regulator